MFGQQPFVAAGMIAMVVRIQYRHRLDFFLLDVAQHRIGFRRVDDGGLVGLLTDNQIAVVITQERDLMNFH